MADFTSSDPHAHQGRETPADARPREHRDAPPGRHPAGGRAEPEPEPMEALLRTLTSLSGPTGEEDEVLEWVRRAWEPLGEVTQSPVGNLFLHLPGPGKVQEQEIGRAHV